MTKKKKWITAEDLMAELQCNPEYLARRARKDLEMRQLASRLDVELLPILTEFKNAGFSADSLGAIVAKYSPLPDCAVSILLRFLPLCREERIQDAIVRALGAAEMPFNGQPLIECFESTTNEGLRFAILNTIALAQPHSITNWLERARQDDYLCNELSNLGYKW